MLTSLALCLVSGTLGQPYEWPSGYFDIYGEVSYQEASRALGVKIPSATSLSQAEAQLLKDTGNIVLWKYAAELALKTDDPQQVMTLFTTYVKTQAKSDLKVTLKAESCFQYAWQFIKVKLDGIEQSRYGKSWEEVKGKQSGFSNVELSTPEQLLVQLSACDGDIVRLKPVVQKMRQQKLLEFEARYAESLAYIISLIPGPGNKAKPVYSDTRKAIELWKGLTVDFPQEPSPFYLVARLSSNAEEKRSYATRYLALERRTEKSHWRKRALEFVK
jgi:hypothetical protein